VVAGDPPPLARKKWSVMKIPPSAAGLVKKPSKSAKPARTTVEVMLNSPDLLVEITVTACIPD